MNILMLGWELPPHNTGGLGVACHELSRQLAIDGACVRFVVPYRATHDTSHYMVESATDYPVEVIMGQFGAYGHPDTSYDKNIPVMDGDMPIRCLQQKYIAHVEKSVRVNPPDIIHAHDWLTYEAGIRAKQITGRPLIAHVHATEFDRAGGGSGHPLIHEIEYQGLCMADRIIAVSGITKQLIIDKYQIPADKIDVVHNSINVSTFDESWYSEATYRYLHAMKQRGHQVVVSVSRFTVQKGLDHLVRGFARARTYNPRLLLLLVGDGEQRDELMDLAAELGVGEHVLYSGFVRGRQWRDAYRIGDIFVMSSVSEPFGLTALEAAGCGNAIIITKQSGVGEVLQNVVRYDYWDDEKLANALIGISDRRALRYQLAAKAREEFEKLSWAQVASRIFKLYQRQVEATKGAAS